MMATIACEKVQCAQMKNILYVQLQYVRYSSATVEQPATSNNKTSHMILIQLTVLYTVFFVHCTV